MTEIQAIKILEEEKSWESDNRKIDAFTMAISALEKQVIKTNADRIRNMTDEELAEDEKGCCGCKLHWKTIQKRLQEHYNSYNISIADGQRMSNPEKYAETLERANGDLYIKYAKHCIGLDRHTPYKRNGKMYYRPYRNYYNTTYNNPVWADLRYLGFAECDKNYWEIKDGSETTNFWLNEDGRRWLAEKLGINKIWEEAD